MIARDRASTGSAAFRLGVAILLLLISAAGCVRRADRNDDCQWPSEMPAPLDMSDAGHRRHLLTDIEFAEELGIRHGDSFRGRETVPDRGRRVDACTDRLLLWIGALHSVPADDIARIRGSRDWRLDAVTVFAPMALLLWVAAELIGGRVRRRFSASELAARLVASLLVAVVVAVCVVAIGELWSWAVEMTRVGDGHLSYRAFRLPWTRNRLAIFLAGVAFSFGIIWWRGHGMDDDAASPPG